MISLMLATALAASPASSQTEAAEDNRMVCRESGRTGTRFARRICKPASEWRAISDQAQRAIGDMRDRPFINPVCRPPSC